MDLTAEHQEMLKHHAVMESPLYCFEGQDSATRDESLPVPFLNIRCFYV